MGTGQSRGTVLICRTSPREFGQECHYMQMLNRVNTHAPSVYELLGLRKGHEGWRKKYGVVLTMMRSIVSFLLTITINSINDTGFHNEAHVAETSYSFKPLAFSDPPLFVTTSRSCFVV